MKEPKGLLIWRSHQRKGSIMKPSTFTAIERSAMKRYHIGKARAAKVAGHSYWLVAQSKYRKRKRR